MKMEFLTPNRIRIVLCLLIHYLPCNEGFTSYYTPVSDSQPVYYSNNYNYGNTGYLATAVPTPVHEVAMQLAQQKHSNQVVYGGTGYNNNGIYGYTSNLATPYDSSQGLPNQNIYSNQVSNTGANAVQYSTNSYSPGLQQPLQVQQYMTASQQAPQWQVVSSPQTSQLMLQQTNLQQQHLNNIQSQTAVQPTSQPLQYYDTESQQFLTMVQPLFEPETHTMPLNPNLYFIMPNNMISQYPNAVVVARGEPQPGYSIVKWAPENQVTSQTLHVQSHDQNTEQSYDTEVTSHTALATAIANKVAKEYNDYDYTEDDYAYDGSDYDYLTRENYPTTSYNKRKYNKPINTDYYEDDYKEYDYNQNDYSSNDYNANDYDQNDYQNTRSYRPYKRQKPIQRTRNYGRIRRFQPTMEPRRHIYARRKQYMRNRNNIPMYMRFARVFGPKYAKASRSARRRRQPIGGLLAREIWRRKQRNVNRRSRHFEKENHDSEFSTSDFVNEITDEDYGKYDHVTGDEGNNGKVVYKYVYVEEGSDDEKKK